MQLRIVLELITTLSGASDLEQTPKNKLEKFEIGNGQMGQLQTFL